MGNTSSHSNGSAEGSGHATPASNNGTSSLNPTSTSTSAPQPIATGTTVRSGTAPVFHSGLTPPARTPSPPPPSTPPLLPYAGHLSPQNPHALALPQAHDYSKTIVTGLIMEAKLAPFYRGLDDFEEDWTEDQVAKALQEVQNSVTERIKEEKEMGKGVGSVTKKMIHRKSDARKDEESQERDKRERRAYIGAIECPICFLVRQAPIVEADLSTIHPISTLRDAVNNQSVLNALSKLNEENRQLHISNLNLPAVLSA
jgi:hypothetical protein